MSKSIGRVLALLAPLLLVTPLPAQTGSGQATRPTSSADRLFLSFSEDATVVEGQWWEGRAEFTDGDLLDSVVLRGVVAFHLRQSLEVGGTVGFGNSDSSVAGVPDGSGATDLDAWAKYQFGTRLKDTEFAVGGNVTVPTGDDTAGLGHDAFGLGLFGSVRHRLPRVILTGNLGLRLNGDSQTSGLPERDGDLSPSIGLGTIAPISDRVGLVGELRWEGERFDGGDDDVRLLGGVNWHVNNRGQLRAAIVIGASDGAPDAQFLAGYAARF